MVSGLSNVDYVLRISEKAMPVVGVKVECKGLQCQYQPLSMFVKVYSQNRVITSH